MNTNDNSIRNRMNPIALWRSIREPRMQRVILTTMYAVALIGGLSALTEPPSSIEGEFGLVLTRLWAGFLIVAGLLGTPSVFPGRWWLERIALVAGATATGIYATVVITLHIQSEAGNRIPQAAFVVIAGLMLSLRWLEIRHADREPRTSSGTPVRSLLTSEPTTP